MDSPSLLDEKQRLDERGAEDEKLLLPTTNGAVHETSRHSRSWTFLKLPNYIASFEGLRGFAVLGPHLSHIVPMWNRRVHEGVGRTGITIFYVMSGFLVTGVLMGQQRKSQEKTGSRFAHIRQCWINRFVRLFPAMAFTVLVTYCVRYHVNQGKMPEGTKCDIINALFYVANFEPCKPHSASMWKNTYSMANQEQWFIVWSISLPIIMATSIRTRFALCAFIILFSYFGRILVGYGYFYTRLLDWDGVLTSVWRLQAGALLRLVPLPRWVTQRKVAWAGLALFVLHMIDAHYGSDDKITRLGLSAKYFGFGIYSGPVTLVISLLLVLGSINGNSLFETQMLRFMGRISYSWYLFQFPLLIIDDWPRNYMGFAHTCVAFVFATFSTLYVEEPIRDWYKDFRNSRRKNSASSTAKVAQA